jgi:hypothetical protein
MPYAVAFGLDQPAAGALWAPRIYELEKAEHVDPYWWMRIDLNTEATPAVIREIAAQALPSLVQLIGDGKGALESGLGPVSS